MQTALEKTTTIRKLHVERGKAYGRGDVEGYLSYYADDASMFIFAKESKLEEMAREVRSLFERGGRVVTLDIPAEPEVLLNEAGDAAVVAFAWRETFKNPDGTITNSRFYETDIWFRRRGQWKIVKFHFTTLTE